MGIIDIRRRVIASSPHIVTATGSIVTFRTPIAGALAGLTANVDPVQDLHGQDNPYPGGGGKNKFPITMTTQTKNGTTFTVSSDGAVTISGTPTEKTRLALNSLELTPDASMKFSVTGSATGVRVFCRANNSGTVTYPTVSPSANIYADITYDQFTLEVDTTFSGTATTLKFQLEAGTTVTDWAPYSNICPITGHTGMQIYRTGKNLLNDTLVKPTWYQKDADGSVTNTNGAFGWEYASSAFVMNLPAGSYRVYCIAKTATGASSNLRVFRSDNVQLAAINNANLSAGGRATGTFTIDTDATVGICFKNFGGYCWFMICESDTPTDAPYTAYVGSIYPISWQAAGTVYGGTVDSEAQTLTVDRRYIVLDGTTVKCDVGYGSSGPNYLPAYAIGSGANKGASASRAISSYLKRASYASGKNTFDLGDSNSRIAIHIGTIQGNDGTYGYNSLSELLAAVNAYLAEHPLEVCYYLATPIVYNLSDLPTVTTLKGLNNIWSDTGDTTVRYWTL